MSRFEDKLRARKVFHHQTPRGALPPYVELYVEERAAVADVIRAARDVAANAKALALRADIEQAITLTDLDRALARLDATSDKTPD